MFKRLFEPWPKHHHDLQTLVSRAHASEHGTTLTCALRGFYLPHGGRDDVLIRLGRSSGCVTRTRIPLRQSPKEALRNLSADECQTVDHELVRLGIWRLGHSRRPSMDGWPCAIAVTDGARSHSIQTHNPEGEHLALIGYILSLIDVNVSGSKG